ncbi:hypothetical protein [Sphingomonas sp.]|uniref:hypothetical protein n=1 Tax=Sphingomonas sp. TaxID=28214 RepID=UPI002DD683A8|nr:hypothetical protein [Sphingomonas sp.]
METHRPGLAAVCIVLAAIDAAGALVLASFLVEMLRYDGVMIPETPVLVAMLAAALLAVWLALLAYRRGHLGRAITWLALPAVPTLLAGGFWLYLEANPIRWN